MSRPKIVKGDIFESDCQTLVVPVNCVGVMGKGLALEFKNRFPSIVSPYKRMCHGDSLALGRPRIVYSQSKGILFFPTKDHWRHSSTQYWIRIGLRRVIENYKDWGITSIAFPALGCGEGGLRWKNIKGEMVTLLSGLDISVEIYQPKDHYSDK